MYSKSIKHDAAVIQLLREKPTYAELYLQSALEDIYAEGGIPAFLTALRQVVDARGGIGEIAEKSGLSREQLYRTLSAQGNPTIKTLTEVTRAANIRLFTPPASTKQ